MALRSFVLVLVAVGCHAGPKTAPQPSTAALPQLPPPGNDPGVVAPAGELPAFPDGQDAQLTVIDKPAHDRAREAAKAGRWQEAKRLFGHLAFSYPEHPILLAQYNAVAARLERAQAASKAALEATPLRTPPTPPSRYTLVRKAPAGDGSLRKLVKKSEKPNGITDEDKWFAEHQLHLPQYFVEPPNGTLWAPALLSALLAIELKPQFVLVEYPSSGRYSQELLPIEIPPTYGSLALSSAIDSKPYVVAIYGQRVVVVFDAARKVTGAFDLVSFQAAAASQTKKAKVGEVRVTTSEGSVAADLNASYESIPLELEYALAADGVLYVEHRHNGYTKEAKGQSGYLTALDLATGELLWRSPPQVCNVDNFLIVGGSLICGYGFTSEPRWATVTDRATGATTQKMSISTTPDLWLPKDGSLYVHGYRADFVFDLK